jgi:hypothetical protein
MIRHQVEAVQRRVTATSILGHVPQHRPILPSIFLFGFSFSFFPPLGFTEKGFPSCSGTAILAVLPVSPSKETQDLPCAPSRLVYVCVSVFLLVELNTAFGTHS